MRKNESGQALVLVLLSLAVVLTIILFILSRSITDISVSSGQAESVRAFSAAEAGIETTLIVGAGSSNIIGDASYTANVSNYAEGSTNFDYPAPLISGDTMTTWFMAHDASGNMVCDGTHPCFRGTALKVCWGNTGTPSNLATTPAIEVSIYYESTPGLLSTVKIARATYDPNVTRNPSNSFATDLGAGICTINGTSYAFNKTIIFSTLPTPIPASPFNVSGGLVLARVKLLYNTDTAHVVGTVVTGTSGSTLPSQGQNIESTGTAGQSNRKINVFQGWPEFMFGGTSVFSPNGITK